MGLDHGNHYKGWGHDRIDIYTVNSITHQPPRKYYSQLRLSMARGSDVVINAIRKTGRMAVFELGYTSSFLEDM
jgi:hypothetical protein